MYKVRLISIFIFVVMLLGFAANMALANSYTLTDLGTLGGTYSYAYSINEVGQIVGESQTVGNSTQNAFLWENGVMTGLGSPHSYASAINNVGQIAGTVCNQYYSECDAFLWEAGVMTTLGTLGGISSAGNAINDAGQIVGYAETASNWAHAFVWENGVMTDLGTLGGNSSTAWGINDLGQIVGEADPVGSSARAVLWDAGTITDLGTLGGAYSYAYAINNIGQIVGESKTASNETHAFLWEDGVMIDLGTLGGTYSYPNSINDAGQVVGSSLTAGDAAWHAFLWEDGVMTDLGTLGGDYSVAYSINENGQITGYADTASNVTHAFLAVTPNQSPTASAGEAYSGNEGSAITMSDASASDPDADELTYSWSVNDPATCTFDDASQLNPNLTCSDDGSFTATLTVVDGNNPAVTSDVVITVTNVAPTAVSFTPTTPDPVVTMNTPVTFDAIFTDPAGTADNNYTCDFDWNGDGTVDSSITSVYDSCAASVNYNTVGVYTARLTVTDGDGAISDDIAYQFVVVYDPGAGFVTGGGWIDSPAHACPPGSICEGMTGKANFGFVSKYKKGATVPTGDTEFNFTAGNLNFHSDSYDWLVINQNNTNAQYKGSGTINGGLAPNGELFKFKIWATDNDPGGDDTFRIKIWYEDNGEIVVYDNGVNQAIGGGNIKIHNGK